MIQKRFDDYPDQGPWPDAPPRRGRYDQDDDADAAIAERVWRNRAKGSTKPIPIPSFPPPPG